MGGNLVTSMNEGDKFISGNNSPSLSPFDSSTGFRSPLYQQRNSALNTKNEMARHGVQQVTKYNSYSNRNLAFQNAFQSNAGTYTGNDPSTSFQFREKHATRDALSARKVITKDSTQFRPLNKRVDHIPLTPSSLRAELGPLKPRLSVDSLKKMDSLENLDIHSNAGTRKIAPANEATIENRINGSEKPDPVQSPAPNSEKLPPLVPSSFKPVQPLMPAAAVKEIDSPTVLGRTSTEVVDQSLDRPKDQNGDPFVYKGASFRGMNAQAPPKRERKRRVPRPSLTNEVLKRSIGPNSLRLSQTPILESPSEILENGPPGKLPALEVLVSEPVVQRSPVRPVPILSKSAQTESELQGLSRSFAKALLEQTNEIVKAAANPLPGVSDFLAYRKPEADTEMTKNKPPVYSDIPRTGAARNSFEKSNGIAAEKPSAGSLHLNRLLSKAAQYFEPRELSEHDNGNIEAEKDGTAETNVQAKFDQKGIAAAVVDEKRDGTSEPTLVADQLSRPDASSGAGGKIALGSTLNSAEEKTVGDKVPLYATKGKENQPVSESAAAQSKELSGEQEPNEKRNGMGEEIVVSVLGSRSSEEGVPETSIRDKRPDDSNELEQVVDEHRAVSMAPEASARKGKRFLRFDSFWSDTEDDEGKREDEMSQVIDDDMDQQIDIQMEERIVHPKPQPNGIGNQRKGRSKATDSVSKRERFHVPVGKKHKRNQDKWNEAVTASGSKGVLVPESAAKAHKNNGASTILNPDRTGELAANARTSKKGKLTADVSGFKDIVKDARRSKLSKSNSEILDMFPHCCAQLEGRRVLVQMLHPESQRVCWRAGRIADRRSIPSTELTLLVAFDEGDVQLLPFTTHQMIILDNDQSPSLFKT
uniref:Uncharacterized protein n=1 Tax=Timspurckia oligopyrenoides TaxID=708627 RepID=A0A7S1ERL8_9RHOD|mmetsp:Transcript_277/g.494  ORF Transcript_277/g.494 Transcript_277/m.494 type:complete len:873 (+) Transcript_277:18-2636(+)